MLFRSDEYLRKTTANVRNILRGLLNKQIGNDKLPEHVFPLFASNLADEPGTVEPSTLHSVATTIMLKPPSKEKFLSYVQDMAKKEGHPLSDDLMNILKKELNDSHISFNDVEKEIRTSPRRWHEIIKYMQAADEISADEGGSSTDHVRSTLGAIDAMFKNTENEKT